MGNKKQKSRFTNAHKSPSQQAAAAAPIPVQSRAVPTAPAPITYTAQSSSPIKPKQSMAQKRAEHALLRVTTLEKKHSEEDESYGLYVSYVKALPATIRLNGLGQAMAMEKAKETQNVGHKILFGNVSHWLLRGWESSPWKNYNDIFVAITQGSQADYLRAHAEALTYLDWLKKFAVAMLLEPENKGGE